MAVEFLLHTSLVDGLPLGLGFALAALVVTGAFFALDQAGPRRASWESRTLVVVGLVLSGFVAVRGSAVLLALNAVAALACWLGAAHFYRDGGILQLDLLGYGRAGTRTLVGAAHQPIRFIRSDMEHVRRLPLPSLTSVLVVTAPALLFLLLFASADAVFASFLADAVGWLDAPGSVVGAVWWAAAFSWFLLGLARYTTARPDWAPAGPARLSSDSLSPALITLNLLFAAFLIVQFAYLFGGADVVARTGGLTRAAYAREGFFQLVTVAALVMAGSVVITRAGVVVANRVVWLLRLLFVQTGVVLLSALERLDLYVDAFGLTRARFYGAALLVWVGLLLVLAVVLLAGRQPERFALAAAITGLLALLVINIVNPDGFIARTNLDRADHGAEVDGIYLAVLVPDATAVLVDRFDELPCPGDVVKAINSVEPDGWRNWNWSRRETTRLGAAVGSLGSYGRC